MDKNKSEENASPEDVIEEINPQDNESPLIEETVQLKEELEKSRSDALYLRAEFDNFKRNAIKDRSEALKYGSENLVRELLNVVDIFDTALETEMNAENIEQFKKGIEMVQNQLTSTLERFGVKGTSGQGEAFDPSLYEAIGSEPTDEIEPGHILRVFKKAYRLHDRVIRPGQVIVAKEPEA